MTLTDEALGRIGFEAFEAFWEFDPDHPPAPPGQQTYRAWEVAACAIRDAVRAESLPRQAGAQAERADLLMLLGRLLAFNDCQRLLDVAGGPGLPWTAEERFALGAAVRAALAAQPEVR